jgi:predicted aspartyl protease
MDMGRTFVNAAISGTQTSNEYHFLVDTGATYIGVPVEEILESMRFRVNPVTQQLEEVSTGGGTISFAPAPIVAH